MNKVDNNYDIVGLFSLKPKEETPEGVSFGRTSTAAGNVRSSLSYATNGSVPCSSNSSQGPGIVASTVLEQRVVCKQTSNEKVESNDKADKVVSEIIAHMDLLKEIQIENDVYYGSATPDPNIEVFKNAIELLMYLKPENISRHDEVNDGLDWNTLCEGSSESYYTVNYNGKALFTVTHVAREDRFQDDYYSGIFGAIETKELFNELYFAPGAPGYQAAKSEFEELQITSLHDDLKGLSAHE